MKIFCISGAKMSLTDLFEACKEGDLARVKSIVEPCPSLVLEEDEGCYNAHDLAVQFGHFDILKYLVDKGADIFVGRDFAVRSACGYGHLKIVKYLVSIGADITADKNYAIEWASMEGNMEVVKYLISMGATIIESYNNAIHAATVCDRLHIAKYLIRIILDEMKKYTLLLLLNKSKIVGKDLVNMIVKNIVKHIEHYSSHQ